MLGTQTQGGRMEGVEESTELWRQFLFFSYKKDEQFLNNSIVPLVQKGRVDNFSQYWEENPRPSKPLYGKL